MSRALTLRVIVAGTIVAGFASACLYGVPDIIPRGADGGDDDFDVRFDPPRDGTSPFDANTSGGSGSDACAKCNATPLFEGSGLVTAFALEDGSSTAYLAVRVGGSSSLVSFSASATTPQPTTIGQTTAPITHIAGAIGNTVYFLSGGELQKVTAPSTTPTTIPLPLDGGTFAPSVLARGVDPSGFVFVQGGMELRRVAVATGVSEVLSSTMPASTIGLRFVDDSPEVLYWLEPVGTSYAFTRFSVSTKILQKSASQYLSVFAMDGASPVLATTTNFSRLASNAVSGGTTIATHSGNPTALAVADETGNPTTAYWVENNSNVVRHATSTSASTALNPISATGGGATSIVFLGARNDEVFIVGNATNDRYIVARF